MDPVHRMVKGLYQVSILMDPVQTKVQVQARFHTVQTVILSI
jgi:hypothetical protein